MMDGSGACRPTTDVEVGTVSDLLASPWHSQALHTHWRKEPADGKSGSVCLPTVNFIKKKKTIGKGG